MIGRLLTLAVERIFGTAQGVELPHSGYGRCPERCRQYAEPDLSGLCADDRRHLQRRGPELISATALRVYVAGA